MSLHKEQNNPEQKFKGCVQIGKRQIKVVYD